MPPAEAKCRSRRFAIVASLFLSAFIFAPGSFAAAPRPNIILIMADDLGYECIGANGSTSYQTPVLDRLAATGVRFDHCYAQPLCTPTRVQLMTGLYNVRNYVRFGHMDPGATTFAHFFRKEGYATCIAGKWQLGRDVDLPKKFGWDEACLWQHTRRPPRFANPGLEINGVEKDYDNGEYGPKLVNDYALDFISRHKDKPFLLYYPMILTHSPFQPTPESEDWDPQARGEKASDAARYFPGMVHYMDQMIGRLVARLDELDLRRNTMILFIGDNGTGRGVKSRMGERVVRGGKGSTTAAGMHVPMIVNWPGNIVSGRVCPDLVDSTDFLPTICEAARVPVPAEAIMDGRSFLPQMRGERGDPRQWVYSWYSPRGEPVRECAFNRHYKLYRSGEFYDLEKDIEERHPLKISDLEGEAREAAALLGRTLERFADARPAHLMDGR